MTLQESLRPIDQAQQTMQLTPQERALFERHLDNLRGPGKVVNPDGSISTLYQMDVAGPEKRVYNIPSVYDGQIVSPDEAKTRAGQYGWNFFPSYATSDEAKARYQQMHSYMDQDVQEFNRLRRVMRPIP
jgi:hypothetical protein